MCRNKRLARHRVFDGLAQRGKANIGRFCGFKRHLIVNGQLKNSPSLNTPTTGARLNSRSTRSVARSPTPGNPESPLSTNQTSNFSRYRNP